MSDIKLTASSSGTEPSTASTEPFTGLESHGNAVLSDGPTLRFVKEKGIFRPLNQPANLRNSLLFAVGYLELANAGDFAANYWNDSPLPIHAIGLMAFGGTLAFLMLYFAWKDARLSWQNIRGLLVERRSLLAQRAQLQGQGSQEAVIRTVDCYLHVNFREFGTEIVDRIVMDSFLGFGAILVGVGTYMAIAGANPYIFFASNLLTGYIGNSPCALFGLANFFWSSWVWLRARHHRKTTTTELGGDTMLQAMIRRRTLNVQLHSILSGVAGIIAGAASLATATESWAYVVLAPCISASALANYFWRRRVGYNRPFVARSVGEMNELLLMSALRDFIINTGLYETFCLELLREEGLAKRLFGTAEEGVQSTQLPALKMLASDDVTLAGRLLEIAKKIVIQEIHSSLHHQERWLLETLGCYMELVRKSSRGSESTAQETVDSFESCDEDEIRTTTRARRYHNANSYCGRHTNEWLKLEFSPSQVLMRSLNELVMAPWIGRHLTRPIPGDFQRTSTIPGQHTPNGGTKTHRPSTSSLRPSTLIVLIKHVSFILLLRLCLQLATRCQACFTNMNLMVNVPVNITH
ncbi:hypothetical protein B0T22DRAFT_540082, partial [Podospora appendiculata]